MLSPPPRTMSVNTRFVPAILSIYPSIHPAVRPSVPPSVRPSLTLTHLFNPYQHRPLRHCHFWEQPPMTTTLEQHVHLASIN